MSNKLKDLRIVEVSLVDRAANKRPLLLLRSAEAEQPAIELPEELLPALEKAAADGSLLEMLHAKGQPMAKDATEATVDKSKETGMDRSEFETLAKANAEAKVQIEMLAKANAEAKAQLEEFTKRAESAEAKLVAEIGERRRRDAVVKVEKSYPHLDGVKVVSQLLKAEMRGADDVKELDEILLQAELLAKSGFREIGSSAVGISGASDAWSRIEAGGAAIQKSATDLTKERAIDQFLRTSEGRALYREYEATRQ
ncbi:MAG: hypothetical protein V2A73_16005 [Pseudomonadota bacterium]